MQCNANQTTASGGPRHVGITLAAIEAKAAAQVAASPHVLANAAMHTLEGGIQI